MQYTPRTRPWRTLLRVESLVDSQILVNIPAWNWRKSVPLSLDILPDDIRKKIEHGFRFYADVNIGAEDDNPQDLTFSDFRLE